MALDLLSAMTGSFDGAEIDDWNGILEMLSENTVTSDDIWESAVSLYTKGGSAPIFENVAYQTIAEFIRNQLLLIGFTSQEIYEEALFDYSANCAASTIYFNGSESTSKESFKDNLNEWVKENACDENFWRERLELIEELEKVLNVKFAIDNEVLSINHETKEILIQSDEYGDMPLEDMDDESCTHLVTIFNNPEYSDYKLTLTEPSPHLAIN